MGSLLMWWNLERRGKENGFTNISSEVEKNVLKAWGIIVKYVPQLTPLNVSYYRCKTFLSYSISVHLLQHKI